MDSMNERVKDFIANEVPNWNDEMVAVARFKAFSGQRCDWQPNFLFWRHLIIKIATHFGLLLIRPSQVKSDWFNRGGLTPLCLDQVMSVMYNEGDITRTVDLVDPNSGRFSQLVRKVSNLITRSATPDIMAEECVIVTSLLKDKGAEVVKHLSESHWNSSCIITMKKFQDICGGSEEASVILRYMSECKRAQYLSVHKKELLEGVKISLSAGALSGISDLDCDVLYLIWTTEKLQQQLDVTDRHYMSLKRSALASLRRNRELARKFVREMNLVFQSREKCCSLLNRVEEVLGIIADAESTKKVSEAMQIGARAIKENKINVEDVDLCLRDIQESIDSQKEVEMALEQTPSYTNIEDEDIEEEFKVLELTVGTEAQVLAPEKTISSAEGRTALEAAECISDALSNLKLSDGPAGKLGINRVVSEGDKLPKNLEMEAA